jgi:hypothetical protein
MFHVKLRRGGRRGLMDARLGLNFGNLRHKPLSRGFRARNSTTESLGCRGALLHSERASWLQPAGVELIVMRREQMSMAVPASSLASGLCRR